MGAAKKIERMPEEKFIEEALREGRATLQELSMKAIGQPDMSLQQRVDSLVVPHVARIEGLIRDGHQIFPMVVFRDPKTGKLRIADGFHRWKAHLNAKCAAIRAYVVDGDYRDALVYSTMCNRLAMLGRKPADIKKAVFALLADEEWLRKPVSTIALHVGVTGTTINRYIAEFCQANNRQVPDTITRSDNRVVRKRNLHGKPSIIKNQTGQFYANLEGRRVSLGKDPAQAEANLEIQLSEVSARRRNLDRGVIQGFLASCGLSFKSTCVNPAFSLGCTITGHGVIAITYAFAKNATGRVGSVFPEIHGSIRLARQLIDPSLRAVVVCYPDDVPPELLAAARADGVEYLTPEELVASIKGESATEDDHDA